MDWHRIAILDRTREDEFGQRILHVFLDHALERTRPVGGIIALGGKPIARVRLQRDDDLAIRQKLVEPFHLDIDDGTHLVPLEAVEQDDLVDPVEKFRPEMGTDDTHHILAHLVRVLPFGLVDEEVGTEIGGHHNQRIAEIDRTALTIRQTPVIQHLQQDVEDIGVRLLDLVEQDHLIGPATHGLGERAALLVADIAGRGTNQSGNGVFLHIFRHVDADQRGFIIEQIGGECLGEFRLADTGRAEKHERANGAVRILKTRPRAPDRCRDGNHRLFLPDDTTCEFTFHFQELVLLAFEHFVNGNARPARYDLCNVVCSHGYCNHGTRGNRTLIGGKALFEVGNKPVSQLAGFLVFPAPLGVGEVGSCLLQLFFEFLRRAEFFFLGLPALREG